jgi:hypothetical protein
MPFKMPSLLQGYQFKLQVNGIAGGVYLQGTKFPGRRANDITLDIGGSTVRYPGIPVNDQTWTLKCFDNANMDNRRAFDTMMGDTPFFMDRPSFQKKQDMTLFFGNSFENKLVLYSAYINNLGEATLDYSDHNPVQYEVTFNFQYWKFV